MSEMQDRRSHVARVAKAVEWFTRLREEDVSEAELAAWFEWCADAENLKEFQKVGDLWRGLSQLEGAPADKLASEIAQTARGSRRRVPHLAVAASLSAAVIGVAALFGWRLIDGRADYTAQATIQSNDLPDGSQVTLAPRSALTTAFSGQLRAISMAQGEAFFKVHPDKSKPFVVKAEGVSVTAVGTAFDVNADSRQVVVTVQEGTVDVAGAAGASWRVSAGSQIVYDSRSNTAITRPVDTDQLVAWHTGRLEYVDKPLGQVVADITRYSGHSVVIGDSRLAQVPYTGAVLSTAIDDWLAALQTTFPIRVTTTQEGHYVLLSRSSPPSRAP
jgi:transmembrane sensor